jgi:hypothetical protein
MRYADFLSKKLKIMQRMQIRIASGVFARVALKHAWPSLMNTCSPHCTS